LIRRKTNFSASRAGGAHGDEAGCSATGRGTANASSRTGDGNGVVVTAPENPSDCDDTPALLTDGFFNASGFFRRTGAGHDSVETVEEFRASLLVAVWAGWMDPDFSVGVCIDFRGNWVTLVGKKLKISGRLRKPHPKWFPAGNGGCP
jgi:hypothetical protein